LYLSVTVYGCKTWLLKEKYGTELWMFEERIIRRLSEFKREEIME
jgi:hypothetical protein